MKLKSKLMSSMAAFVAFLTLTLLSEGPGQSNQGNSQAQEKIQKAISEISSSLENAKKKGMQRRSREKYFTHVAKFPVFWNTNSALEKIGFVDISNPYEPEPGGVVDLDGEPNSVTVVNKYALACINTSGKLVVIDVNRHEIVRAVELGGQPDAIAASPDGRYAAIAVKNERNEDLGDGAPPQDPAEFLVIVDLVGNPDNWSTRNVDLNGIAKKFPEDPETELVDINSRNIAAVTLQENNHVILVRLSYGEVIHDFSAGTVSLSQVYTLENDLIELTDTLVNVPGEPDALTWIGNSRIGTADEDNLDGGSRGFTIFSRGGSLLLNSGNNNNYATVMLDTTRKTVRKTRAMNLKASSKLNTAMTKFSLSARSVPARFCLQTGQKSQGSGILASASRWAGSRRPLGNT